jgi:cation transport ATPase
VGPARYDTTVSSAPKVVFVDVDDTLVRSFGAKRIPISSVVAHVRALHEAGFRLYCWSSGGADYARDSAEELGILHCFVDFLPKPHVLIDDQAPADWRTTEWVHTNEAASRTPSDY